MNSSEHLFCQMSFVPSMDWAPQLTKLCAQASPKQLRLVLLQLEKRLMYLRANVKRQEDSIRDLTCELCWMSQTILVNPNQSLVNCDDLFAKQVAGPMKKVPKAKSLIELYTGLLKL